MEEAWELAVVSEEEQSQEKKKAYSRADTLSILRVVKQNPWRFVLGTVFLYGGVSLFIYSEFNNTNPTLAKFMNSLDLSMIGTVMTFAGAIVLFPIIFRAVLRSTSTSEEILEDDVQRKISSIQDEIEHSKDKEKVNLLTQEINSLKAELQLSYDENLRTKSGKLIPDWREALMMTRKRLIKENTRLGRRSRANLTWGIIWSLTAVVVVAFFVFKPYPEEHYKIVSKSWLAYSVFITPKIALFLTVQILAGFFLRNFLSTESEIQRNKNEVTNVELRLAAGLMNQESKTKYLDISKAIASEERNFILGSKEKSANKETSVLLERLESVITALKP